MHLDYTSVTEIPGCKVTREQKARLYQRYHTASRYIAGKRVLEVACGPGLGLGYLARTARNVVGADYTENLLRIAYSHYRGSIPLVCLDAHHLPFRDKAFDVVIILEAIYYFSYPERAIAESRRILSDDGMLLISTWNKDWAELIPSPLSTRYLSVPELRDLLVQGGFSSLEFFGGFPTRAVSSKQKIISLIRRLAIALNLVPNSLKMREILKRLFYGRLVPLGSEIEDGMAELSSPVPIRSDIPNTEYKVLYAIARPL